MWGRVKRRSMLVGVGAGLGLSLGLAALYACGDSNTTTGITPITGIQIRSDSLVAGKGCGREPGQVFKYVAAVYHASDDGGATGDPLAVATYDCFTDALFQNLAASPTGQFSYALTVLAFNAGAYDAQSAGIDGAAANGGAIGALKPTWTTSCTATQQSDIEVLAVCAPLGLAPGDGAITVATDAFKLPSTEIDGAVVQHGCGDPDGYAIVEVALGGSLVEGDGGAAEGGPPPPDAAGGDAAGAGDAGDGGPSDAGNTAADAGGADAGPITDGGAAVTTKSATCPDPITFAPLPVLSRFQLDVALRHADGTLAARTSCHADTSPGVASAPVCAPLVRP